MATLEMHAFIYFLSYGAPRDPVAISAVCTGSEQNLTSCQLSACSGTAAAGVQCSKY